MFSRVARNSVKTFTVARRGFSAGNAAEETARWKKLSGVMVVLSVTLGVYNVIAHDHEHMRHDLPYLKLRSKPYPWECPDCNLFDQDCWNVCRGGEPAAH